VRKIPRHLPKKTWRVMRRLFLQLLMYILFHSQ